MPSNTYRPETKYKSRLSRSVASADTTLYVDALPAESAGILVINKDSDDNYEIVLYAGTDGAGTDADPYKLTDCVRGLAASGSSLTAGTGKTHGKVEIGCVDTHYFVSLLKAHVDGVQTLPAVANLAALPTSSNTQFDIRFVQSEAGWYYWSLVATSGTTDDWVAIPGGTVSNATETALGKVELATTTDHGNQAETGDSGGPLAVQPKNIKKQYDIYTPAFLVAGPNAESNSAIWDSITDGEFAITIDGTARDITGIDFTGDASMTDVASTIQTAIRAVTSASETVSWTTVEQDIVKSGTLKWTASGSGTNEYYLELDAGGDPGFPEPTSVLENSSAMSAGNAGVLLAGEWDYADNDTLGYSTIYVRLTDGVDPDTKSDGYLEQRYTGFKIASGDTTSTSAITVASSVGGGSGTDISDSTYLDADSGNGEVNAKVENEAAHENYLVALDSSGEVNDQFIPQNYVRLDTATTKGDIYAATASATITRRAVGTNGQVLTADSTDDTGLSWASPSSYAGFADTGSTGTISATGNTDVTFTPGFEAGIIEVHIGGTLDGSTAVRYFKGKFVFDGTSFKWRQLHATTTGSATTANWDVPNNITISGTNASIDSSGSDMWSVTISITNVTSTEFDVRVAATKSNSPSNIGSMTIGVIAFPA